MTYPTKRLKFVATIVVSNVDKLSIEGQKDVFLCNYTNVYHNDRIVSGMGFMAATATDEQIKKFSLRPGDVLITKDSESPEDIAVPSVVSENIDNLICGYHLAMIRPSQESFGPFLNYALKSLPSRDHFAMSATGITRFGLSRDDIVSAPVMVPPLQEQQAIAAFLDRETAEMDALLAAKERMLSLMAEKRKALITEAVTRGLNTEVEGRDSGVPWIGEIPAHWPVKKIAHFAHVGNGSTPDRENVDYWREGIFPWLNSSYVNQEAITEGGELVSEIALRACHLPIVKPGSLLIGITGQGKTRGLCSVLEIEATINQHIAYISPNPVVYLPAYLRALLSAAYEFMRDESDGAGSTKGAITCEQVSMMRVCVPPLDEQRAIVAYIEAETAKLDALKAATERTMGLLKERRSALIAAAVTGQIRVQ